MSTAIRLPALDGFSLAASAFEPPAGRAPRAAVVIASAMGVARRYYEAFAERAAASGLAVLTFDYRGIGESRPPSLRGFAADLGQWGEQDLAGALRAAEARWPGAPLLHVGHSVGGQLLGLAPGAERVKAAMFVAAQSGHWRGWSGAGRARMWALWWAMIPAIVPVFGYLPMRRVMGSGEDVPAGVALEWARWGRDRDYVLGFARRERGGALYPRLDLPIRAYAIEDDPFAPRAAVEGLLRGYERARIDLRSIGPRDVGGAPLGHFGFFRWPADRAETSGRPEGAHSASPSTDARRLKEALWSDALSWLDGFATSPAEPAEVSA